jgi:hypothetical protein
MAGWWSDVVDIVTSMPRAVRTGGRFGRIFKLRDRGRLEEAFAAAVALADELLTQPRQLDKPNAIVAAATVDELAVGLGKPGDARQVLERALEVIEREQVETHPRGRSAHYKVMLDTYERRFRERLRRLED